jgi:hypothetical protein
MEVHSFGLAFYNRCQQTRPNQNRVTCAKDHLIKLKLEGNR